MARATGWQGVAFNQATESENRMHADDVARQYGFAGGLVPGVTVHAYLVHPALVAWGADWLARGAAEVALKKPLYDGAPFRVEVTNETPTAYTGEVLGPDGVVCASGRVELPSEVPAAPARRGDPPVPPRTERPSATPEAMERLWRDGMGALRIQWRAEGELDRYVRDPSEHPAIVRPGAEPHANPAFVLGLANWILARNVRLGPWIHAESRLQNHAPITLGDWLTVEARIVDLFERRDNRFVDLEVCAHAERGPVMHARHRAIYEPRRRA